MWQLLRSHLKATSWPIIAAMLALMVISVLALRAAELADPTSRVLAGAAKRQTVYAAVALAAFLAILPVHYQRIGRLANVLFGLSIALLVAVFFVAEDVRGSQRWFDLGIVKFQPSEPAKISYILAMAWYLRYRENYRRCRGLVVPFALTGLPFILILLEPSLGTSLLLFPTLFFMLFLAGAKLRHLLGVIAATMVLVFLPLPRSLAGMDAREADNRRSLAYWVSPDRQKILTAAPLVKMNRTQVSRIVGWLGQSDPTVAVNEGYQLFHSMVIISSGGFYGQRQSEDMNLYYRVLPDDHTDFIFAVVAGQWGLIGCAGVLLIYFFIILCGVEIASKTQDPFGRLLAVGVTALTLVQVFINVAMTMGMMPITGMTLPLLSYGGSSMVVTGLSLGLLVNVGQRRPVILSRKSFEFLGPEYDEV